MIDVIKITLISIILLISFIFTLLTVETTEVTGEMIRYCRPIEIWCQSPKAEKIVYDSKTKQYFTGYQTEFNDVTVKDGKFYSEVDDVEYKTNADDGTYESINGILSWDVDYVQFIEFNENTVYIGGIE